MACPGSNSDLINGGAAVLLNWVPAADAHLPVNNLLVFNVTTGAPTLRFLSVFGPRVVIVERSEVVELHERANGCERNRSQRESLRVGQPNGRANCLFMVLQPRATDCSPSRCRARSVLVPLIQSHGVGGVGDQVRRSR